MEQEGGGDDEAHDGQKSDASQKVKIFVVDNEGNEKEGTPHFT